MSEDKKLIISILELIHAHTKATGKILKSIKFDWDKEGKLEGYSAINRRTQKAKEMTLEEAKSIVAAQSHYKRWENIVDEFHGTDDYSEYLEKAAKLCIASLESQLREKEEHYGKLEVVANRWHNEYLRLESEKEKEIERLKELFEKRGSAMQDLSEQVGLLSNKNNELREALRNILALYSGGFSHKDNKLFLDRCRKLIGE